jgi:hypothetical protein
MDARYWPWLDAGIVWIMIGILIFKLLGVI